MCNGLIKKRGTFALDFITAVSLLLLLLVIILTSINSKADFLSNVVSGIGTDAMLLSEENYLLASCSGIIRCDSKFAFVSVIDEQKLAGFSSPNGASFELRSIETSEVFFSNMRSQSACSSRLAIFKGDVVVIRICI